MSLVFCIPDDKWYKVASYWNNMTVLGSFMQTNGRRRFRLSDITVGKWTWWSEYQRMFDGSEIHDSEKRQTRLYRAGLKVGKTGGTEQQLQTKQLSKRKLLCGFPGKWLACSLLSIQLTTLCTLRTAEWWWNEAVCGVKASPFCCVFSINLRIWFFHILYIWDIGGAQVGQFDWFQMEPIRKYQ